MLIFEALRISGHLAKVTRELNTTNRHKIGNFKEFKACLYVAINSEDVDPQILVL